MTNGFSSSARSRLGPWRAGRIFSRPGARLPGERLPGGRTPDAAEPGGRASGDRASVARAFGARAAGVRPPGGRAPGARTPVGPPPGARSPAAFWRGVLRPWRTRRLLVAHLLAAALCALVAAIALLASCNRVQDGAQDLASRDAPAVQGLAATRLAVLRADQEARALTELKFVDVVGSGETYRSQLSAADQGLSRIADRTDQDLGTVNGLLASYRNSITLATLMYRDEPLMREQKLTEATSLLTRQKVGLVPRLDRIQRAQLGHAETAVVMGRWQRAVWWLAELALGALALTLLSALFVLRDRCGRDWNLGLLAALVLTVLLAVLPLRAMLSVQHHLDGAVRGLWQLTEVSRQDTRGGDLARAQQDVTARSERVGTELAGGTWPDWAFASVFTGGLLVVLLPVAGLGARLDKDYWRRR